MKRGMNEKELFERQLHWKMREIKHERKKERTKLSQKTKESGIRTHPDGILLTWLGLYHMLSEDLCEGVVRPRLLRLLNDPLLPQLEAYRVATLQTPR